ncbi:protein FAM160B1 [Trichonephila clavata]|uniref:Protein FAM160B1 n=1 Tax=Trichonephila clavata TaxID=2740835 RepID=A0A8X6ISB7_TRICU|nr:protein FAM160B1 [Trichonephila clavata]
MFSRFTNALYSAVDALAPPHPLQEDFVWHWKSVTKFYTGKNASNTIPIESTSIPAHLKEMLTILEQEEIEIETGNIGPCVEYIMQHKLLDTMCVLATSDSPPGMKRHMFIFITKTLKIMQQSLIPHVSVCIPIQNFIKLCGEVVAGPTEREEMDFLQSICDKIRDDPDMVNCFLVNCQPVSRRNSMIASTSKECESNSKADKEYALVSSLLKLYQSPDNDISVNARDCLKTLCTHSNDSVATNIAQFTKLSQVFCSSVVNLFSSIPKTIKIHDLENPLSEEGAPISPDKRKYLCYLQQLHFIDSVIETAHHIISDHLSYRFKTEFLDVCFYPCLIEETNDDQLLFSTTLIASSLRNVKSSKLIDAFATFILDDESAELSENSEPSVKAVLMDRCRNSDENVALSICNLQLFEELLLRPTKYILDSLILKYIDGRGYYDHMSSDSWLNFSDDETCSRYSDDLSTNSGVSNKSIAPTYIHRIIDAFIALLPDDIKSCQTDEDSGYETYIKEAHRRFLEVFSLCESFEWPQNFSEKEDSNLGAEDDSSSESQPEADSVHWIFHEGDFLKMIFDKFELMLYQPYEVNLQLTAIISQLALFANPYLHEYLLNPLIPYAPGVRSLFLVLLKISEDIQKEVPNIRGFATKLKLTRNALLSDGNEYATFEESHILEALIVLEEFCKELAAITFVKYHAMS